MQKTAHRTYCPFKGYATYWALHLLDQTLIDQTWQTWQTWPDLVWSYEDPFPTVAAIQNYMAFDLSQPKVWYEQGETLYSQILTGSHSVTEDQSM